MGQHRWCWFRCLHRRQHNRGRPLTEHVVEPAAELRVTIANKEADPTSSFLQDSHQVTGLLGDPGGVGGSQPSQDYRMADAIQASRIQPTHARWGPERVGPERQVARRRQQLPQGQRVARAGRAPGRLPVQGRPGDGHRPAAPAPLPVGRGLLHSVRSRRAEATLDVQDQITRADTGTMKPLRT
jgi:hypothetical protein